MAAPIPYGAAEIIALRSAGKRPADMVLVSFVGPLREENHAIVAKLSIAYDWRCLVGLSVLIVATTQCAGLASVVRAIQCAAPDSLSVWFADKQDGINALIGGSRPNTKAGRRMDVAQRAGYAGLGSTLPADDCLRLIAGQVKRRAMENAHRFDSTLIAAATAGYRQLFGRAWEATA